MQKYAIQLNNRTVTIVEGNVHKTAFLLVSAALLASFAMYLFFVGTTIFNIVERKNTDNDNRSLSSRVSELELSYLSESNKIDLNLAYSLGFKDATGATFAYNGAKNGSLSLAGGN